MRVRIKNVREYEPAAADGKHFEAELYINGYKVGDTAQWASDGIYFVRIDNNDKARKLYDKAEKYLSEQPSIQTLSTAVQDALLRHKLVAAEFISPHFISSWERNCVAVFEARLHRFRVLRFNAPINELCASESDHNRLLATIARLLLRKLDVGDLLVDKGLPEKMKQQLTAYIEGQRSAYFRPGRIIIPYRPQGKRPK